MSESLLDQLESNLVTKKVSIVDFAEDPKFCNKSLYPKQRLLLKLIFLEELTEWEDVMLDGWIKSKEIKIAPDIRERTKHCRERGYKHFSEIVLVGGRRSSKGFLTGLAMGKKMYDTLQLQDPNQHYGIDANKEIYFTCVAASEKQAKELQYADLSSTVNSCQVMQPYIHKLQELEFSLNTEADKRRLEEWKRQKRRIQRDISKLRGRALASNARTIRGYTSMAICFDEFAHFMQGESDAADDAVYEAAHPSLAQFGQDGIIFCNSSPYTKVGKMYERFEISQATSDDTATPTSFGIQFPSWAMFEDWWKDATYRGAKKCITPSPDWDPEEKDENGAFLYTKEDRNNIMGERSRERDNPDKYKVERRARWAEVVDSYLNPEMVDRMYMGRPLTRDTYEPFPTNWNDSTYRFKYKAHLDPSSTTAGFGFALGHVEMFKLEDEDGVQVEAEHVVFDIVKRWQPADFPDGVIDWAYVIREVVKYSELFWPYEISFDQFQSAAPIQELRRTLLSRNIDCRVFEKTATAQHNWNRAECFKTALYQGLVHVPSDTRDVKYCGEELKYLQEIKTGRIPRVEKQDVGPVQTKDMADCVMEVVEGLIGNVIAVQQRQDLGKSPSFGAPGGYPLGGLDRGGQGIMPPALADIYSHKKGEQAVRGDYSGGRQGRGPGGGGGRRKPNAARGGRFRQ
jgi:hypothetical protein